MYPPRFLKQHGRISCDNFLCKLELNQLKANVAIRNFIGIAYVSVVSDLSDVIYGINFGALLTELNKITTGNPPHVLFLLFNIFSITSPSPFYPISKYTNWSRYIVLKLSCLCFTGSCVSKYCLSSQPSATVSDAIFFFVSLISFASVPFSGASGGGGGGWPAQRKEKNVNILSPSFSPETIRPPFWFIRKRRHATCETGW